MPETKNAVRLTTGLALVCVGSLAVIYAVGGFTTVGTWPLWMVVPACTALLSGCGLLVMFFALPAIMMENDYQADCRREDEMWERRGREEASRRFAKRMGVSDR